MIACADANTFIEDLAAGDPVPDPIAAHVQTCPQCAARLRLAHQIEHTLAARPVEIPPPAFTNAVVSRVRHESWRSEQLLDLGFNVFVVAGVGLIVAGIAGLVWASGLVVFSREVFDVLDAASRSTVATMSGQARTFMVAALLLTLALGVWWWVEQGDVTA